MRLRVRKRDGIWKVWLTGWDRDDLLIGVCRDWPTTVGLVRMFCKLSPSPLVL